MANVCELTELDGKIALLTFDAPGKKVNTFGQPVLAELTEIVTQLEAREDLQGLLSALNLLEESLCEITGFAACSLLPAAGAHGEYLGMLVIRALHRANGEEDRRAAFGQLLESALGRPSFAPARGGTLTIPRAGNEYRWVE